MDTCSDWCSSLSASRRGGRSKGSQGSGCTPPSAVVYSHGASPRCRSISLANRSHSEALRAGVGQLRSASSMTYKPRMNALAWGSHSRAAVTRGSAWASAGRSSDAAILRLSSSSTHASLRRAVGLLKRFDSRFAERLAQASSGLVHPPCDGSLAASQYLGDLGVRQLFHAS